MMDCRALISANALGFRGEIMQYLADRLVFRYHIVKHVTRQQNGVLAHQQIAVEGHGGLLRVDLALKHDAFLCGIIELYATYKRLPQP